MIPTTSHRHRDRHSRLPEQEYERERTGQPESQQHSHDTIVLIGGMGGLEARYRATVEGAGYTLRYYEARVPASAATSVNRVALVIVVVTMVSHPLLAQARKLAGAHAPMVYLKSHSVSALRQALVQTAAAFSRQTERQVA
jgi:hypothetical protein